MCCIHTYANPTKLIIENITSKKGTLYIAYTQNEDQYKKVLYNQKKPHQANPHLDKFQKIKINKVLLILL